MNDGFESAAKYAKMRAAEFMSPRMIAQIEANAVEYVVLAQEILKERGGPWYDQLLYTRQVELYDIGIERAVALLNNEKIFWGWHQDFNDWVDVRNEQYKKSWYVNIKLPSKQAMKNDLRKRYGK